MNASPEILTCLIRATRDEYAVSDPAYVISFTAGLESFCGPQRAGRLHQPTAQGPGASVGRRPYG
jgi:hypothetical protein